MIVPDIAWMTREMPLYLHAYPTHFALGGWGVWYHAGVPLSGSTAYHKTAGTVET